jgi:ubiquitin carboxyl-terminal hydrolase 25/28
MANNDSIKSSDPHEDPASMSRGVATIPPSTFYGTQNQRPALPNRPAAPSLGSASTGHYTVQPPEKSPFREPELVPDDSEQLPALGDYATNEDGRPFVYGTPPQESVWPSVDASPWPSQSGQYHGSTSSNPFSSTNRWVASGPEPSWGPFEGGWVNESTRRSVTIDGRNESEEMHWWNAQVRSNNSRPGHGILPPVLADNLHHPEHTLFSVTVTPPDLKPSAPSAPTQPQPTSSESPKQHRSADSASSLTDGQPSHTSSSFTYSPTAEEVRTAVPHPNAYYCRKHNGWVLLIWKSSSVNPPFSRSFKSILPDPSRRRLSNSCIGDGEQPFGPANITHHFHAYERAVNARRLTHPFNASQWENEERSKLRHRKMTLRGDDPATVMSALEQAGEDTRMDVDHEEGEGDLLDLYVCCQCSFYVIASDVIPGVVPVKLIEDLVKSKMESPPPGKSGELAALLTLETILKYVCLWAL